jgi:hypothetical protein
VAEEFSVRISISASMCIVFDANHAEKNVLQAETITGNGPAGLQLAG